MAAGRETFEEAGLVLARNRGGTELVDAATANRLVAAHRARLLEGGMSFADTLRG